MSTHVLVHNGSVEWWGSEYDCEKYGYKNYPSGDFAVFTNEEWDYLQSHPTEVRRATSPVRRAHEIIKRPWRNNYGKVRRNHRAQR